MSNELPGEWGEIFGPRQVHSYRDLAVKAEISKATAHRLVNGGATSAETVNKVADKVLDGNRDLVWRLRGSSRRDHGDWSLPADASLLTAQQREAVIAVIQAMVPDEREDVMGNAEHPAPISNVIRVQADAAAPQGTSRPRGRRTPDRPG